MMRMPLLNNGGTENESGSGCEFEDRYEGDRI
jgi:hypothetical protein